MNRIALLFLILWTIDPIAGAQLTREANTTLTLPSTLPSPTGYTTENALAPHTFSDPVCVAFPPGVSNRVYVVEQERGVQCVDLTTNTKSEFFNINTVMAGLPTPRPTLNLNSECGLLSLAFHPSYNQNGFLYIFHSVTISSTRYQRVARLQAAGTPGNYNAATGVVASSYTPILSQKDDDSHHNGSDLHFGPDGYLYISVGDEGGADDLHDNARRIAKDFFGAVLRIDVDSKPENLLPNAHSQSSSTHPSAIHAGTYRVPVDNPFTTLPVDGSGNSSYGGFTFPHQNVRTEIWATGFRNPWRMSFDPVTGRLFVADVGQGKREEINLVTKGFHGGWSWMEGSQTHTPPSAPVTPPAGVALNAPIYDYARGTGDFQGGCVTGGIVYRGSRIPSLNGSYIFGDYNSGRVWALREEGSNWVPTKLLTLSGSTLAAFGRDPRNGDVLICERSSGVVKRLVPNFGGTNLPTTLSATGAFANLGTLTPHQGIVPYEITLPFWSDHAYKARWFSIPSSAAKMTFETNGNWAFPNGQVWIKHFEMELTRGNPATRRRVETRFLVKNSSGIYGLTYKWRPDGLDADLVDENGLDETLSIQVDGVPTTQVWRYPSRSECTSCHTPAGGYALGFNTAQLNREHVFGSQTQNQIGALAAAGYFENPAQDVHSLPAYPDLDDESVSREARVRAYLAVNCSQCHRPNGGAQGNWDARITTPTDAASIINGSLVTSGGDNANRFIVPGDLGHSVVRHRLQGANGFSRMPPMGSNVIDAKAVQLISDWALLDLPTRQSLPDWQTTYFGSPNDPEAAPTADPDFDGLSNGLEFLNRTSPIITSPSVQLQPNQIDGLFRLEFVHPANRSVLVETSTNLVDWSLWEVAGNRPFFPASATPRILEGPMDGNARHFRLRFAEP